MHIPACEGRLPHFSPFDDELSQTTSMSMIHSTLCSVALEVF
jgi:hypothetical protein